MSRSLKSEKRSHFFPEHTPLNTHKHTQDDIKYTFGARAKEHQPWMGERKNQELNAAYFYYKPLCLSAFL